METKSPLTQTQFNTAIASLRQLLLAIKDSESQDEQVELLAIVASAAHSLANKIAFE
jgi:hypothetical protein